MVEDTVGYATAKENERTGAQTKDRQHISITDVTS